MKKFVLILNLLYIKSLCGLVVNDCPRECTCETAPLKAAPFVQTWLSSWGENDLPDTNPNEVFSADMMAPSETALDAQVDIEASSLQATCSIHPTTNITNLLASLPKDTKVLSILQAPGCNFTILEGGQLVHLKALQALHIQGYAHIEKKQVSGFSPNSVAEFIAHKKLLEEELKRETKMRDRRFALAEDALQALQGIQLLDLQYVRLVASREDRRSRRYSKEPLSATTLVDMPLPDFLHFADQIESFQLPPHMQYLYEDHPLRDSDDKERKNDKTKLQGKIYVTNEGDIVVQRPKIKDDVAKAKKLIHAEEMVDIVPYEIYKAETQPQLAPFKHLKKLKYLRVAHAKLDKVGPELLEGLHELHTLTLEYNRIKILPRFMFSPTPNLRHLSLAHNNILLLEAASLEGLSRLLTIDLDHNQLSILGPASFPSLPSLTTLRVKGNPIIQLLPDTFTTINSTTNIILGSLNKSMDVHENSFRFLYNLNTLILYNTSTNSLKKNLLRSMSSVENLEIHGNISEIDYDAFSTTYKLKNLNISFCNLEKLSVDAFYGLRYLISLDLSNNALSEVSPGTFDHLISLRELYLHHNLLSTLPVGIFFPIPAKLIQLHFNPWHCSCDLMQLHPVVTNKVKRSNQLDCHWDEILGTVCSKIKDRYIYDARVAPLCHDPVELSGNDVYHAAKRHLKCDNYQKKPQLPRFDKSINVVLSTKYQPKKAKKIVKVKRPNSLPLSAYTPAPIRIEDLLDIAARDGLEEIFSEDITSAMPEIKSTLITNKPMNDEPIDYKKFLSLPLKEQRKQKKKIKSLIESQKKRRQDKKKLRLLEINRIFEKKMKLKQMIAAKKLKQLKKKKGMKNFKTILKQESSNKLKSLFA